MLDKNGKLFGKINIIDLLIILIVILALLLLLIVAAVITVNHYLNKIHHEKEYSMIPVESQEFERDDPEWKKSKQDDLHSMSTGIMGYKGRVVLTIADELNPIFDTYPWINDRNAQVNCVCSLVDKSIHSNMVLYPINYLAYDLKYGTDKYAKMYTAEEQAKAADYLNGQLAKIDIPDKDEEFLWQMLLTMYSNPVANKEALERERDEITPLT